MSYNECWVTFTFEDAYGRTKSKRVELVTTVAATAELDADAMFAVYDAVTEGGISKYVVSGAKFPVSAPAAGSNVDSGVTVSCSLAAGGKAALKWPMPDPTLINPDGSLDLTAEAVTNLEDGYKAGGEALISDGEIVTAFISGKLDK